MREIKFRAWEINEKKMIDLKKLSPFALDSGFVNDALVIPFVENLVLMQYTGLKDKNGKEIYEGDIITGTTDKWNAETKIGDRVEVKWGGVGFLPFSSYDSDCGTGTEPKDVEIIGNIWEHEHLLNQNTGTVEK